MPDEIPCGETKTLYQWRREIRRFFLYISSSDQSEIDNVMTLITHGLMVILQYRADTAVCSNPARCTKIQPYGRTRTATPAAKNNYIKKERPWYGIGLYVRVTIYHRMSKDVTCE